MLSYPLLAPVDDTNLVTDVVDNAVIKRKKSGGRKTGRQRLCLGKGYNSAEQEQDLIKRGYLLHIPIKNKKKKKTENLQDI